MKGITMDCESVRGILADLKGNTRRPAVLPVDANEVRPAQGAEAPRGSFVSYWREPGGEEEGGTVITAPTPPGLYYVKEPLVPVTGEITVYRADRRHVERDGETSVLWPWKARHIPARYCPRWASRLTIEVTSVRVERLTDISEADARAEGCTGFDPEPRDEGGTVYAFHGRSSAPSPIAHYRHRWDAIYSGKPGCAWADNPWVWVIEFRRVEA